MAGNHTNDLLVRIQHTLLGKFADTCNGCGGCGFNTDTLIAGKIALHGKNLCISYKLCGSVGLTDCTKGFFRVNRCTDTDCGCNRLRVLLNNNLGQVSFDCVDNRHCTLCLNCSHHRQCVDVADVAPLAQTFVDCGDISGIADRQNNSVRNTAKLINRLKTNGLLTLKPVRVDGV